MSEIMETIELDNSRKFTFRKMKISDYNLAAKSAARVSGNDQMVFQVALSGELLKLLLVSINGVELDAIQRENLDSVMSVEEYNALLGSVGDSMGKLKIKSRVMSK